MQQFLRNTTETPNHRHSKVYGVSSKPKPRNFKEKEVEKKEIKENSGVAASKKTKLHKPQRVVILAKLMYFIGISETLPIRSYTLHNPHISIV